MQQTYHSSFALLVRIIIVENLSLKMDPLWKPVVYFIDFTYLDSYKLTHSQNSGFWFLDWKSHLSLLVTIYWLTFSLSKSNDTWHVYINFLCFSSVSERHSWKNVNSYTINWWMSELTTLWQNMKMTICLFYY